MFNLNRFTGMPVPKKVIDRELFIQVALEKRREERRKKITWTTKLLVLKFNILKYKDYTCEYCHRIVEPENIHFDHRIPLSKGGNSELNNIYLSCSKCNLSKNNKTDQEFITFQSSNVPK